MRSNPENKGFDFNTIPAPSTSPDTEPKPTTDIENIDHLTTQIEKEADELRDVFAEADKITEVTAPAVEKAKALRETITKEIAGLEEKKKEIEKNISKDISVWESVQHEIKEEIDSITKKLSDPKEVKRMLQFTRRTLEERLEHLIHSNEELMKILGDGKILPEEIISLQLGGLDIPQDASESIVHASELYEITSRISARKLTLFRLSLLLKKVLDSERATAEIEAVQEDELKKEKIETETDLDALKKIMGIFAREVVSSENSGWDPESLCKETQEVGELIKTYNKFGDNSQGESFRVRLQIRLNSAIGAIKSYFEEAEASSGEAVHYFGSAIHLYKKGYLNEVDFSRILSRTIENCIYSKAGERIEAVTLLLADNGIPNILLTNADTERIRIALDYVGEPHSGVWRTTVGLPIKLTDKKVNLAFSRISSVLGSRDGKSEVKLSNPEQIALASYYANMGDARYLKGLSDEDARQVAFLSFRTFFESNINNGIDHSDYLLIVSTLCRNEGGGIMTSIKRGLGVSKSPKVSLKDYCQEILSRYYIPPLSKRKSGEISGEDAFIIEAFGLQDEIPKNSEFSRGLEKRGIINANRERILRIVPKLLDEISYYGSSAPVLNLIQKEDPVIVEQVIRQTLYELMAIQKNISQTRMIIKEVGISREIVEDVARSVVVALLSQGDTTLVKKMISDTGVSEDVLQDEELREAIKKFVLERSLSNAPDGQIDSIIWMVEGANFPNDFFNNPKLQENVKNLITDSLLNYKFNLAQNLIRVFKVPETTVNETIKKCVLSYDSSASLEKTVGTLTFLEVSDEILQDDEIQKHVEEVIYKEMSSNSSVPDLGMTIKIIKVFEVKQEIVDRVVQKTIILHDSVGDYDRIRTLIDVFSLSDSVLGSLEIQEIAKKGIVKYLSNGYLSEAVDTVKKLKVKEETLQSPEVQEAVKNRIAQYLFIPSSSFSPRAYDHLTTHDYNEFIKLMIRVFKISEETLQSSEVQEAVVKGIVKRLSLTVKNPISARKLVDLFKVSEEVLLSPRIQESAGELAKLLLAQKEFVEAKKTIEMFSISKEAVDKIVKELIISNLRLGHMDWISGAIYSLGILDETLQDAEIQREAVALITKKLSMEPYNPEAIEEVEEIVNRLKITQELVRKAVQKVSVQYLQVNNERINTIIDRFGISKEAIQDPEIQKLVINQIAVYLDVGHTKSAVKTLRAFDVSKELLQDPKIKEAAKKRIVGALSVGHIREAKEIVREFSVSEEITQSPEARKAAKKGIITQLSSRDVDSVKKLLDGFGILEDIFQDPEIKQAIENKSLDTK